MENFNKNSLKAAVAKYGPLHTDGKAEADVKAEMAKDEKGYSPEQIDEIYAAIIVPADLFGGDQGAGKGEKPEAELLEAQTPEWVQTILDSNQAVLDSNQKVVDALEDLKLFADERSSNAGGEVKTKYLAEDQFDEDEDYVVAEGKSFRDSNNFSIEYKQGEEVTHLGADRLKVLLSQGLVQEA